MALRPWSGVLIQENVQTGDGRVIAPGAVEWADLPLPLAWIRDGDQHVDMVTEAPQVGTIATLDRQGDDIVATGFIDDANPDGAEVCRRMDEGTAPLGTRYGISADPDDWEVELILADSSDADEVVLVASGQGALGVRRAAAGDPDPGEGGGPDGETLFQTAADEVLERYTRMRVRGATLCAVAAFDGASIGLDDAAEAAQPAVAPVATAASLPAPARPPSAWFSLPEPELGDERLVEQPDGSWAAPLTITDDGQVWGHLARAGQDHRGFPGMRLKPPRSSTGYREFHTGYVVCDDGTRVATGPLTVEADHAPLSLALTDARDYYANSALGWADVRVVDGLFGPWVCGSLRPGWGEEDLRVLRALSLSGDWRGPSERRLELVAALAVNYPGYPIAREALAASAFGSLLATARTTPEVGVTAGQVTALVAAGVVARCSECAERMRTELATERINAVEQRLAVLERRTDPLRSLAASAIRSGLKSA